MAWLNRYFMALFILLPTLADASGSPVVTAYDRQATAQLLSGPKKFKAQLRAMDSEKSRGVANVLSARKSSKRVEIGEAIELANDWIQKYQNYPKTKETLEKAVKAFKARASAMILKQKELENAGVKYNARVSDKIIIPAAPQIYEGQLKYDPRSSDINFAVGSLRELRRSIKSEKFFLAEAQKLLGKEILDQGIRYWQISHLHSKYSEANEKFTAENLQDPMTQDRLKIRNQLDEIFNQSQRDPERSPDPSVRQAVEAKAGRDYNDNLRTFSIHKTKIQIKRVRESMGRFADTFDAWIKPIKPYGTIAFLVTFLSFAGYAIHQGVSAFETARARVLEVRLSPDQLEQLHAYQEQERIYNEVIPPSKTLDQFAVNFDTQIHKDYQGWSIDIAYQYFLGKRSKLEYDPSVDKVRPADKYFQEAKAMNAEMELFENGAKGIFGEPDLAPMAKKLGYGQQNQDFALQMQKVLKEKGMEKFITDFGVPGANDLKPTTSAPSSEPAHPTSRTNSEAPAPEQNSATNLNSHPSDTSSRDDCIKALRDVAQGNAP